MISSSRNSLVHLMSNSFVNDKSAFSGIQIRAGSYTKHSHIWTGLRVHRSWIWTFRAWKHYFLYSATNPEKYTYIIIGRWNETKRNLHNTHQRPISHNNQTLIIEKQLKTRTTSPKCVFQLEKKKQLPSKFGFD